MIQVGIIMGSLSDEEKVRPCADVLKSLDIKYRFTISSAHRSPERTEKIVREMEDEGCQVFICAAGMAAHLAGVVASKTIKPVLGIPISASSLGGLDALLSTVMMPPGFPVGTLALDKAGAKNAAWMAAQILANNDSALAKKIKKARAGFIDQLELSAKNIENS